MKNLTCLIVLLCAISCAATNQWSLYVFSLNPRLAKINVDKVEPSLPRRLGAIQFVKAAYKDTIKTNGFSFIDLQTNPLHSNEVQAYTAGWAEGHLTKQLISYKINNSKSGHCPGVSNYCPLAEKFIQENLAYMQQMIQSNPKDPYWQQIHLILIQLQGMEDAYYGVNEMNLTLRLKPFGLFQLSSDHEIDEILASVRKSSSSRRSSRKRRSSEKLDFSNMECSAMIKLLPGNVDLYMGHATWRPYSTMLKIIKRYNFHFKQTNGREFPGNKVTYTSEPGYMFSSNDWYIIQSGLVTMETTIGNRNSAIAGDFKSVGQLVEWIRNLAANRIANTGAEWCEIFARHNSGTYNNQWMIVDYNKFVPGKEPAAGLFHVLEQIPGMIRSQDMTSHLLERTYWASYNYPYFPDIQRRGNFLGDYDRSAYDTLPRAQTFALNQRNVNSLSSMFHLMRKNDYQHNPFSKGDPGNAIASRYDLRSSLFPPLFGATDAKITNYQMSRRLQMIAECGPTHYGQPPFKWSKFSDIYPDKHEGQPDEFNFKPIFVKWRKDV